MLSYKSINSIQYSTDNFNVVKLNYPKRIRIFRRSQGYSPETQNPVKIEWQGFSCQVEKIIFSSEENHFSYEIARKPV